MKKLFIALVSTLLAIVLIAIPVSAASIGLVVSSLFMSPSEPTVALIEHQPYNELGIIYANNDIEYYLSYGTGLPYFIKCNGDWDTAIVSLSIVPSSKLAKRYKAMPEGFAEFDTETVEVNKLTYTEVYCRISIPDKPKYRNKRYQCSVEITYQYPGNVGLSYVYGDTIYVVTAK